MTGQAELVINAQAILGEGSYWDQTAGRLYWVDIEGKQLRSYDPKTQGEKIYTFDKKISAAIPAAAGGWILALQDGVYRFSGQHPEELIAEVEPEFPRNRLNDAKCDSSGRLWFGTMSMDYVRGAGSLYVMETDGQVRQVFSGISISNGLAWDDQRGLMYYIDTPTRAVDVMDYDQQSGTAGNRRPVFQLPEGVGDPDGMTIDREGMLWVAHWGGGCVSRWNPHTGEQIGTVEVPAKNVTSCTFGGEALDELYITTARDGMSEEELQRWPLTGGLFKFSTGVQGVAANVFNG